MTTELSQILCSARASHAPTEQRRSLGASNEFHMHRLNSDDLLVRAMNSIGLHVSLKLLGPTMNCIDWHAAALDYEDVAGLPFVSPVLSAAASVFDV